MLKIHGKEHTLQVSYIKEKVTGENHWNWKGGEENKTINYKLRKTSQYKNWRKSCIKKNNYSCIVCGGKDKVEVDHIVPFSVLLKENNIESIEDGLCCENLWNINNGRLLCRKHHKETSTYGQGAKNLLNL